MSNAPKVFLSYSHDTEPHKEWVRRLATDLRNLGIDASLDQWDLSPGQDVASFMERGVTDSDRVILVCTDRYVAKAEAGLGGVAYERLIVTAELVARIDTKKFIPIVRQETSEKRLPAFLGPRLYVDFSVDEEYDSKLEQLAREIHGVPSSGKPPLGANPYSSEPSAEEAPPRNVGLSGITAGGTRLLAEGWFTHRAQTAGEGLANTGLKGAMEVRLALHEPIQKSQMDLLNAVRKSEIRTFGWPIGVILDNREEFRPRPMADGIVAEIPITERSLKGESSYDYWALRANGDFYLLQSLFEDQRADDALFFNTRIVRVAEALLFGSRLYEQLGVVPESHISVGIEHRGLAGRTLGSSSSNRHVLPANSVEDRSQVQIVDTIGGMRERLIEHVRQVLEPMFMLFDFTEFQPQVYADIVNRFVAGEVT